MPTLLSINNYFYNRGGAEAVFLGHNKLMETIGWEVVPFSMAHDKNLSSPWSKYFIDELEFGATYSLPRKIVSAVRSVYSRQARSRLRGLLKASRPTICHAHNIYHHISPSILGQLHSLRLPIVLTLHDLKIACPAYTMLASDGICERCRGGRLHNVVVHKCMKGSRSLSALVLVEAALHHLIGSYSRYVDRFVVPSRFYAKKLQEWGWSADKFRYIPNFVDSSSYVPDYEAGDRFVYFGRLSREKGLQTLIRATAISRSKLAIAGTGPEIAKLRELAGEIQADVQFLGFLSGDALKDAVRSARAVVLPSEWYENAPISILESYALGKPVVGARIGGIPELIREHETGLQFESGNANSLADAMVAIKRLDAQAIGNMGREGRRWVEAEFTPEMYRARTLDVYQELLPSISGHHFEDVAANS